MAQKNPIFIEKQKNFLNFLVSKNLLKENEATQIMDEIVENGRPLDLIVREKGFIKSEIFSKNKAEFLGIPYISLLENKIDKDILQNIPMEIASTYKVVCFDQTTKKLLVGISDINNLLAIEAIDFLANKKKLTAEYYLISQESFEKVFKQYSDFSQEINSALETKAKEDKEDEDDNKSSQGIEEEEHLDFQKIVKDAPVAKIVSTIIKKAVDSDASDIHIEPLEKETRVRFRIDGILHNYLTLPKELHPTIVSRIKVLANLKLDETRIPQDGRMGINLDNKIIDFRISILPLMGQEKVVMRVLDTSKGIMKLEQLGFSVGNTDIINKTIKKTGGIILVTGPTGSGKTTTLYSLLNLINKEGINIITLEDPIEYFIKGVNQSQIKPEIGFTFASGLRSILRQDPNVIMVGEIRDEETAELSIHSALTGHLVLSSLHTNNAIGAIPRLLDMKIEPFLLGSVLNMVVAQKLARRLCPDCKQVYEIPENVKQEIFAKAKTIPEKDIKKSIPDFDFKLLEQTKFYKSVGCSHCDKTGYKSRVCISEVLEINDYIKNLIINQSGDINEENIKKNSDFLTLEQDGIIKILQGLTTYEEIMRVIRF